MAGKTPEVSVIIPVYNTEAYLPECIAALKAQTLTEFEAIFVDDGSDDGSRQILENAAALDARFRIIRSAHENAGAARNKGLKEAKGRYVIFLDADDGYASSILKECAGLLDRSGADIAVFHFQELRNDGTLTCRFGFQEEWLDESRRLDPKRTPEKALFFGGASVWNKMYRRKLLLENDLRFEELEAYNDLTFVLRANLAAEKIAVLDEWLYTYRCSRPQSISEGRREKYPLILDALERFGSQTRSADPAVIDIARAHFLIKTLLMDIGDYRQKQAEAFFTYCRQYLRGTRFDTGRIAAFYPQLNAMICVFRILNYNAVRVLDALGLMKELRRRIHSRKELKK